MPRRAARSAFVSTFTLMILARDAFSAAISSSTGASILQGPHHSAQKSTSTGTLDFRTSVSKFASLISIIGLIGFVGGNQSCDKIAQKKRLSPDGRLPAGSSRQV